MPSTVNDAPRGHDSRADSPDTTQTVLIPRPVLLKQSRAKLNATGSFTIVMATRAFSPRSRYITYVEMKVLRKLRSMTKIPMRSGLPSRG